MVLEVATDMELLAKAVELYLGKAHVLRGIDLSLHPKEFLGIIGPNGSGKSSFLKCVYRVQKPSAGTIYFDGRKQDELSYRESALKLAVLAQHNAYHFDFNVLDVVVMGRSPHKKMMESDTAEDFSLAREMLATVGLAGFEERNFSTLSGGEQQRVAVARALVHNPKLVIADEPTGNIDPELSLEMMQLLERVSKIGITVLVVTHEHELVHRLHQRVVTLSHGRIVSDVPADPVAAAEDDLSLDVAAFDADDAAAAKKEVAAV